MLSVAGTSGDAPVIQVNGRSYVDVEALAQMTGATVRFQGRRIVMTLSGGGPSAGTGSAAQSPSAATSQNSGAQITPVQEHGGLSREFVTAGVGALTSMREWRAALVSAVQHNQPVSDDLLAPYRRNTEAQVAVAAAAARNSPDRSAATLLQNELNSMRTLSVNFVALHDSNTNIRTDAMDTDALSVKVANCMSNLAGMSTGAAFQDIASCH